MTPLRPGKDDVRIYTRMFGHDSEQIRETLRALLIAEHHTPDAVNDLYRALLSQFAVMICSLEACAVAFELPLEEAVELVREGENPHSLVPDIIDIIYEEASHGSPD